MPESGYFEDNVARGDHVRTSLRGGAASIVGRGLNAALQITTVLFLARLLTPEDYGLVSMVTAFTGFAPILVDLGTRDAVVQREKITHGEVSALFWLTIAIGTGFALAAAACGPLIARFYGDSRLTAITMVSAATFLACALSVQHHSLIRRRMMFEELAVIDVGASILSAGVAIGAALLGAGYWALVVRPIATPVFVAAGVWMKCAWIPGAPVFTSGVRDSVRFGLNITGFSMTDFVGRSADRAGVGYRLGPMALGQYQNALFVYDNLLDVLVFPLHAVAVASLSKLRQTPEELRKAWAKALSAVAFFGMPLFGILAVTSRDVVVLLLGDQWAGAAVLLSVLAFRGMPHCVERTLGWLHVAAGRSDRWMRWGVVASVAQLVALACGLPFGAMGVAVAYVVAMFVLFVPAIAYAGHPLQIHTRDVVGVIWRQLLSALGAAAVTFLLRWTILADVSPLSRVLMLTLSYVAIYVSLASGVLGVTAPLRTTQTLVQGYLPARLAR